MCPIYPPVLDAIYSKIVDTLKKKITIKDKFVIADLSVGINMRYLVSE